jgi:5-methylthioadenosine/S-adenosylhomocysteine deaminase
VRDPHAATTVVEVLRAATLGGVETLDMERQIGSLTPGQQADVIVIDLRTLNFAPQMQQVSPIVFNGQPQNVTWVFVAGRVLMEDGTVQAVDARQLVEVDHITLFLKP